MPKRNAKERIESYKKKIRKLERKEFRRIRTLSSSDSETRSSATNLEVIPPDPVLERQTSDILASQQPVASPISPAPEAITELPLIENALTSTSEKSTEAPSTTPPDIDPSILAALGEVTDDTPEFGDKIHESLAKIWTPLLKKGMTKDQREVLLKNYLIPENCPLLQSPILNPEIQAAIPDSSKFRDKKMMSTQQQLGIGITAINRGLNLLVKNEGTVDAIKYISDGCRILSDLHYQNTETRIKFIVPGLEKSFLHFIDKSERDSTLFGKDLSEKIKSSQTIVKQGQQIKKVMTVARTLLPSTSNTAPSSTRTFHQGNGSGPSRYQANRGGRGGYKRTSQRLPQPNTTIQPRMSYKPRAPARR